MNLRPLLPLLTAAIALPASARLIPTDPAVPPLAIRSQRVDIRVEDAVAQVKVAQEFVNHTSRELEATYVFPLPREAAITDFALMINGERVRGEVLDAAEARRIYEEIVRRRKDPLLIEYMGQRLFRARVFPIPPRGSQRVEIEYAHPVPYDSGLFRLEYPLRTGERASTTLEDFTVGITLKSRVPIRSVYSPTHEMEVGAPDDHTRVLGFERDRARLDRDVVGYYGVDEQAVGLHLVTHRPKGEDEGTFMLLITPTVAPPEGRTTGRDMVYVLDTSGSMFGRRMEQARAALRDSLDRLDPADRFNLIRFSTDVEAFADKPIPATPEHLDRARAFVDKLVAAGGTRMSDALETALAQPFDPERLRTVVFLTDGKPTLGVTDPEALLKRVAERAPDGVRLFVFGVGEDVNARLLDRLAAAHGGLADYVGSDEELDMAVSRFNQRIRQPVLTGPRLEIGRAADAIRLHPDLARVFALGTQVLVALDAERAVRVASD